MWRRKWVFQENEAISQHSVPGAKASSCVAGLEMLCSHQSILRRMFSRKRADF
jgi:hypothetical protein